MRRKDRELVDKPELVEILSNAYACRIAINTGAAPYIVPLNFGFSWDENLELYFHSAKIGRKIDLLKSNSMVGFEIDTSHELVKSEKACNWSMKYRSIIGSGIIDFIMEDDLRKNALNKIMSKYGYTEIPVFNEASLKEIIIYKLVVHELSGKQNI